MGLFKKAPPVIESKTPEYQSQYLIGMDAERDSIKFCLTPRFVDSIVGVERVDIGTPHERTTITYIRDDESTKSSEFYMAISRKQHNAFVDRMVKDKQAISGD